MKAPEVRPPLWIKWWAKDALDDMSMLSPIEELAYRRILDLIVTHNDALPDDGKTVAWVTKAGRSWSRVKSRLLKLGKIYIEDGFVRNRRATGACIESRSFVAQKSAAGRASVVKRNQMKDKNTESTGVPASVGASVVTGASTNQESVHRSSIYDRAAVDDGEVKVSAKAGLWQEGVEILRSLTGNAEPGCRAFIGKLMRSVGDADRLLAILRRAQEEQPADPKAWIAAAARSAQQSSAAPVPADDAWGIHAWLQRAGAVEVVPDSTKPEATAWRLGDWFADQIAELLAQAARLPFAWRGDWSPLAEWLHAGLDPHRDILPTIRRIAAGDSYTPPHSLKYFDAAVRGSTTRRAA